YASGMHCGIKPQKKDLAFIYVPESKASAGVFTTNQFCAPCVEHNRSSLRNNQIFKLLIVNSGNANAVTGEPGVANVRRTTEVASKFFQCEASEVAIASTGIIGVQLPMEKLERGIEELSREPKASHADNAAQAIMTTDLVPKSAGLKRTIGDVELSVAGIAKGSGMIAPNMATMLGFMVTDADLSSAELQTSLTQAVQRSFNMMSVDTDTSTSDMVLLFSTGTKPVADQGAFQELLTEVCIDLAKQIARDGEGAEKLIEVTVEQAASEQEAQAIAKSIINSPLVKTAVHGADPNWGRVIMAVGKTPHVTVKPEQCSLYFQDVCVLQNGLPLAFEKAVLREKLRAKDIFIRVRLGCGESCATAWGCDLSKGYIDINVDYN
ncbi:MAG: bifunctional glutamate N-acetyltransferase/amino-acid acetyltransferase ArgJ, partial [Bdellovibrionales bacterium]|nr:bifunctional glutamate N-acetyltransferase/amino-acid acetyltransferase ArgJ [Bdellovibrionales bacterium]